MLGGYLAVVGLAIVFAIVLAIFQGVYWAYVSRTEMEKREIARRLGTLTEEEAATLFREKAKDAAAQALGSLGNHLDESLRAAESDLTVSGLLLRMIGIGGLVFALTFIAIIAGLPGAFFGVILTVAAPIVPYALVRRAATIRSKKILEQLPDALDLMSRSLQAGLGMSDAFRLCAEEMPLPLAGEFGRVFEEVRFGRDYREALNNLVKRNPEVFELRIFVSSVLLQRETGGNLIEILNTIAATVRNRFLFHAKVRALTAEARFSAVILGSLPFFVAGILLVITPQYLLPLIQDWVGYLVMIPYMFVSYSFGIFLMYNVANVDV